MMKTRLNEVLKRDLPPLPWRRRIRGDFLCTLAYQLLRVGLGCLFVYAGFIKLLDPKAFAHSLAQFDLLPERLLPLVAVGLPALELLAGLGLVLEVRGSLSTIAVLLGLFLLVLGYAILMELDIDCGCFTVDEINAKNSVKLAFRRDLLLGGAILFLFWRRRVQANPAAATTGK
ncbi:MAG: MauE/DoxX family redox-associated membrane protein [Pseudomonadota bacterium]